MIVSALTFAFVARIPAAGLADFAAYEDAVLPLLARYGGTIERRLRTADGTTEIHIVGFGSRAGLDVYRADPARLAAGHLMTRSGAATELIEVLDVAV